MRDRSDGNRRLRVEANTPYFLGRRERSKDSVGYLDNNICLGQVRSAAIVCASNCMEATSVLQGTG